MQVPCEHIQRLQSYLVNYKLSIRISPMQVHCLKCEQSQIVDMPQQSIAPKSMTVDELISHHVAAAAVNSAVGNQTP